MRRIALLPVLLATLLGAPPAHAWTWPVDGPVLRPFLFGNDPYAAGLHRGIDIGAAPGTAVRAPRAGLVRFAGTVPGNGRTVTIETADGYSVTLLHLGAFSVARGATVAEGDSVAVVGPSDGIEHELPSVHLGVRVTADPQGYVDPLPLLPVAAPVVPEASEPDAAGRPGAERAGDAVGGAGGVRARAACGRGASRRTSRSPCKFPRRPCRNLAHAPAVELAPEPPSVEPSVPAAPEMPVQQPRSAPVAETAVQARERDGRADGRAARGRSSVPSAPRRPRVSHADARCEHPGRVRRLSRERRPTRTERDRLPWRPSGSRARDALVRGAPRRAPTARAPAQLAAGHAPAGAGRAGDFRAAPRTRCNAPSQSRNPVSSPSPIAGRAARQTSAARRAPT